MATYLNTAGAANPETRTKPRLNVIRGYPGNETTALSRSLSPSVAIKSGQSVADNGSGAWILATNAHGVGKVFIAYHDSTDPDVISCDKLLAFAVTGSYELETGYFKAADVFAVGDPVYCNTVGGELTKTNTGGSTPVIGYASAAIVDWSTPKYGTGSAPYAKDNMAQNTEATAANSKVLRFSTAG